MRIGNLYRKTERQKGLVEPLTFPIHRFLLSSSEFEKLTKQREIAFVNVLEEYVLTLSFNLNPKIGLLSKTKKMTNNFSKLIYTLTL